MEVAVAVASLGRPSNLRVLLEGLSRQTKLPCQVILSMEKQDDCPELNGLTVAVETVFGSRGMTKQRNRALDRLSCKADVVVFYDDDFVPSLLSIEGISNAFQAFPDVNSMTGMVILDGISGPGIPIADAVQIVKSWDADKESSKPKILEDRLGCYGCNMAFRTSAIGQMRFDEKLERYGWFEDLDFSARVPGRCVQTSAFAGVHCGERAGRETNGRTLGYAQVANPYYLWRKGSLPFTFVLRNVVRNVLKNHVYALAPEPWVDRKGRTLGNWLAIRDILWSRVLPTDERHI